MCGIVGAASQRNIYKILIEGLRRLEYRGYDSAGLSILDNAKACKPAKLSAELPIWKSSQPNNLSLVTPAFPIPAGPRMASRAVSTLTHTPLQVCLLSITALLKITISCALKSKPWAMKFYRRPTPK